MRWFLVVFFLVYGSAHLYALLKAKSALGFGWGTALALMPVSAALTCGPLIVYSFARHGMGGAVRIPYPLLSGLSPVPGGGALYTSRGTGTWGPRMRFLSPPEITVIDLVRPT